MEPQTEVKTIALDETKQSKAQSSYAPTNSHADPRTLIFALLLLNALVFASAITTMIVLAIVALAALTTLPKLRTFIVFATLLTIFISLFLVISPFLAGSTALVIFTLGYWLTRFSVVIALATYMMSVVTPVELVAAMYRMHMPRILMVPLATMLRFIPVVREEYRAVREAMALRGLDLGWRAIFHPLRMLELIMVPLLASCAAIADDLAAAALTRGLGSPIRPTTIAKLGFGLWDIAVGLIVIGVFILDFLIRYGLLR